MDLEEKVLELNSLKEFNPMQLKALKKDLFNRNIVISSPTGSGKTLIAELVALNSVINKKQKVIYTCPLRALASEHFHEFKKKYSQQLDIKACLSTGDMDSSSKYLSNYDVIFCTYEKLSSLIRHKASWLSDIGLLIVDEIHELDSDRGSGLEVAITCLRFLASKLQILALSATIPNCKELSDWLQAELIESSFRPVKLREGVFFDNEITFADNSREEIGSEKDSLGSLVEDTLKKEKQALVFANTRKRAQSIARKISSQTSKVLSQREKNFLQKKSRELLDVLESPTEQCRLLSELVSKGIAFHTAGLLSKQRQIVEELFRERYLKVLSATPTLAAGINLPAHTVVLSSVYRYTVAGQKKIPIREAKQMLGRAGRIKYDVEGRGLLIANSELEKENLFDYYILGEPEEINSKLGFESVLRTNLLGLIASDFVFDLASLEEFFSKTFYAFQFKDFKELFSTITGLLSELEEMNFIKSNEKRFEATMLGKRVSELFLDPVSAFSLIQSLKQAKYSELFYLYSLASCYEFLPWLKVAKNSEAEQWELMQLNSHELPIDVSREQFSDPDLLSKFQSALFLREWISEKPEQDLVKEFNVQPGIIQQKLSIMDWLVYAEFELARLLKLENHLPFLAKLRKRVKYGVKEELVNLTEVRFIGRVRARKLFKSNVRTVQALKKISLMDLSRILGSGIALTVKKQLGQETELSEKQKNELKKISLRGQTSLNEF